ncbi:nucleotide exchange factor GrpE [Gemmatimonadota bacterium]
MNEHRTGKDLSEEAVLYLRSVATLAKEFSTFVAGVAAVLEKVGPAAALEGHSQSDRLRVLHRQLDHLLSRCHGDLGGSENVLRILSEKYRGSVAEFVHILDTVQAMLGSTGEDESDSLAEIKSEATRLLLMQGVRPTSQEGHPLNLAYHNVVDTVQRADLDPDTIVEVIKAGYEIIPPGLNAVVVRYADVVASERPDGLGSGAEQASAGTSGETEDAADD